jgi:hypothetical protein
MDEFHALVATIRRLIRCFDQTVLRQSLEAAATAALIYFHFLFDTRSIVDRSCLFTESAIPRVSLLVRQAKRKNARLRARGTPDR